MGFGQVCRGYGDRNSVPTAALGLERQWHQLDIMQTICTSLQADNHTNITHYR